METIKVYLERVLQIFKIPAIKPTDIIEIILISILLYYIMRWVKQSRAGVLVKGIIVLLFFWILANAFNFDVIKWLFENTIGVGITALIILFQPELRKALERIGERGTKRISFFVSNKGKGSRFSDHTLDEIVEATFKLARTKTGALMVIETDSQLKESGTGIAIDGIVSSALLINIFEHNTPLHDGAVVIRGDRIVAATCYLPLSENRHLSKELGTRHRAGVGISEGTDSFTIIVSEETGKVSFARNGILSRNVDADLLRQRLIELQSIEVEGEKKKQSNNKGRAEK